MELTFKQQIIASVIDRSLLTIGGIVVALVTVKVVERYKARQSLLQAIAPERVKRIVEVQREIEDTSEALDHAVSSIRMLMDARMAELSRVIDDRPQRVRRAWHMNAQDISTLLTPIQRRAGAVLAGVRHESFWIGDDMRRRLERKAMLLTVGSMMHIVAKIFEGETLLTDSMVTIVDRMYPGLFGLPDRGFSAFLQRVGLRKRTTIEMPKDVDEVLRDMVR